MTQARLQETKYQGKKSLQCRTAFLQTFHIPNLPTNVGIRHCAQTGPLRASLCSGQQPETAVVKIITLLWAREQAALRVFA